MRKNNVTNRVVFPGIAAWLRENNVTVSGLASMMGYAANHQAGVYEAMCGRNNPSLKTIEKILAATGMTFEEAFARKEEPDAHT